MEESVVSAAVAAAELSVPSADDTSVEQREPDSFKGTNTIFWSVDEVPPVAPVDEDAVVSWALSSAARVREKGTSRGFDPDDVADGGEGEFKTPADSMYRERRCWEVKLAKELPPEIFRARRSATAGPAWVAVALEVAAEEEATSGRDWVDVGLAIEVGSSDVLKDPAVGLKFAVDDFKTSDLDWDTEGRELDELGTSELSSDAPVRPELSADAFGSSDLDCDEPEDLGFAADGFAISDLEVDAVGPVLAGCELGRSELLWDAFLDLVERLGLAVEERRSELPRDAFLDLVVGPGLRISEVVWDMLDCLAWGIARPEDLVWGRPDGSAEEVAGSELSPDSALVRDDLRFTIACDVLGSCSADACGSGLLLIDLRVLTLGEIKTASPVWGIEGVSPLTLVEVVGSAWALPRSDLRSGSTLSELRCRRWGTEAFLSGAAWAVAWEGAGLSVLLPRAKRVDLLKGDETAPEKQVGLTSFFQGKKEIVKEWRMFSKMWVHRKKFGRWPLYKRLTM